MSDTYEKARSNAYKNVDPYPSRPLEPVIFRQRVSDLAIDELRHLADQKVEYEKAMTVYREQKDAWAKKDRDLFAKLEIDLATEFDLLEHPKRQAIYDYAYDKGHSSGAGEIALVYEGLVDLVK